MDELAFKILTLIKRHGSLNAYQVTVLMPIDLYGACYRLSVLYENGYIKPISLNEREGYAVSYEMSFKMTPEGIALLQEQRKENKRFMTQSIYIPIIVALLTSTATNIIAWWLR